MTEEEKSKVCIECHACCTSIFVPINPTFLTDPESVNLWTTRGLYIKFLGVTPGFLMPSVCINLLSDGRCNIYANRPQACKDHDGRKDPFLKDYCKLED